MSSRRKHASNARDVTTSVKKTAPHSQRDHAAHGNSASHDGIAALAKQSGNAALERLVSRRDSDRPGKTVDASTASRLGAAFGVDLQDARIVDDPQSHAAATAIGAQAFAADGAVYIGDQAPAASTPEREALVAHELAHVAQQERSSTLSYGAVNAPEDAHELAAHGASAVALAGMNAHVSAAGAPAAVQRQPIHPSVTKKAGISRAEAQKILEGYFSRFPQKPESKGLTLSEDMKSDLRKMVTKVGDISTTISFDAFLNSNMLPSSPAQLAARVAALLPETVPLAALSHLQSSEYDDPSPEPDSTRLGRLVDLAKKTSPEVGADAQEQGWKFDQNTSQIRDKDKPVLGPLKTITPSVDVERVFNIAKGLPKAWKGEKKQYSPRSYATVDAAVAALSTTSLIPKAFQGTKQADSYANAQDFGASIARDLDIARQKKQFTVEINLCDNYRSVDDRTEMVDEAERIIHVIEKALPHHASKVGQVEIWIGKLRIRTVTLGGGE